MGVASSNVRLVADGARKGSGQSSPFGVKVYELIGSRWVDQGTAFCFGDFQENEALLIARAEEDFNRIILTTTIRATDVYQRQQGA